jgi:hypothetical protein
MHSFFATVGFADAADLPRADERPSWPHSARIFRNARSKAGIAALKGCSTFCGTTLPRHGNRDNNTDIATAACPFSTKHS